MSSALGAPGVCAPTEYDSGNCQTGSLGSFHWPIGKRHLTMGDDFERERGGMQDCVLKCLECPRCNYVSFSRKEHDCSWYQHCNLSALNNELDTGHHTRRVRVNNSVDGQAKAFANAVHRPLTTTSAPPRFRLVDVVAYGGPHYDSLLELRMAELDTLVDLFLVIEHVRPPHPHLPPRGFDPNAARFAPFLNRTRHIVLPNCADCAPVDEFLDVDLQSFRARQRTVDAWQAGYAQVARSGDLAIIADIDEVPRRAALARLLLSEDTRAKLDDGAVFALQGPTYFYHPRCKGTGSLFEQWTAGPRLIQGETLLHTGSGSARYFAGGPRVPTVIVPESSWHLRYFMPAAAIHQALCRHTAPHTLLDASGWWAIGWYAHDAPPNASALCEGPSRVHHAISTCQDLWGRKNHTHEASGTSYARQYTPTSEELAEMPYHMAQRPELYRSGALNQLDQLLVGYVKKTPHR